MPALLLCQKMHGRRRGGEINVVETYICLYDTGTVCMYVRNISRPNNLVPSSLLACCGVRLRDAVKLGPTGGRKQG